MLKNDKKNIKYLYLENTLIKNLLSNNDIELRYYLKPKLMSPIKSVIILALSLITLNGYSQYTDVINSNRPGVSRSAFSVGTNVAQFEVGPYILKEIRTPETSYEVSGFGADFAVRYGLLFEQLELNIEGTFQSDTKTFTSTIASEDKRSNFKFLAIGAKYLVFDPYKDPEKNKPDLYSWKANHTFKWRSLIPAVSVFAGINYDTSNNPFTAPNIQGISPKVMLATQNNFPGGWVFVMNFLMDRIGTSQSDFQYILTLTHSFSPQWVLFGETQGIRSDFYADNLFRIGGAYLWNRDFQLDTALTFNAKDTPSVFSVNLGMSYRLDFHQDRIPKEKEIDNGTSAKDEGERQKNSKKTKNKKEKGKDGDENEDTVIKKQRKDNIDFGDDVAPEPVEKDQKISDKEDKIREKNLKKKMRKMKKLNKKNKNSDSDTDN